MGRNSVCTEAPQPDHLYPGYSLLYFCTDGGSGEMFTSLFMTINGPFKTIGIVYILGIVLIDFVAKS